MEDYVIFNFLKKTDTVLMAQPEEHRSNIVDQNAKVEWTKAFQFSPDISKVNTNSQLRTIISLDGIYVRVNVLWHCRQEVV